MTIYILYLMRGHSWIVIWCELTIKYAVFGHVGTIVVLSLKLHTKCMCKTNALL